MSGGLEPGSWSEWVTAVLALGALAVSAVTLLLQIKDRRRAYAAPVDAFVEAVHPDRQAVQVRNNGPRAVFDVRVELVATGQPWPLVASRCWRIGPQ